MATRYIRIRHHGSHKDFRVGPNEVHTHRVDAMWACLVNGVSVGLLYSTPFYHIAVRASDNAQYKHIGTWAKVSAVSANFMAGIEGNGYNRP